VARVPTRPPWKKLSTLAVLLALSPPRHPQIKSAVLVLSFFHYTPSFSTPMPYKLGLAAFVPPPSFGIFTRLWGTHFSKGCLLRFEAWLPHHHHGHVISWEAPPESVPFSSRFQGCWHGKLPGPNVFFLTSPPLILCFSFTPCMSPNSCTAFCAPKNLHALFHPPFFIFLFPGRSPFLITKRFCSFP